MATTFRDEDRKGGAVLAVLVFLYTWVTLTPFKNLSFYTNPALSADSSNTLNQIVAVLLFGGMIFFAGRSDLRTLVLKPRGVLIALFVWLLLASLIGTGGVLAIRRLIMAALFVSGASAFLLLPRSERQFGTILAVVATILLFLCYAGVVFLPLRSIHQATDYREPMLAGDWRGFFDHKNSAAPSMAILVFVGLYLAKAWNRAVGWAIILLATLFLYKAGGKTALGLLPLTLLLGWCLERGTPVTRWLVVLSAVGGYTALTLGTVLSDPLRKLVMALGVDETFTGRTDIWQLAIDGVLRKPIFGYGYQAFWGSDQLVFGFREKSSWAVDSPSAHNGYLEVALAGGLVGLALTLFWLVVLPLRNLTVALERHGQTPLTRFYVRIWIFSLVSACMESMFLDTSGSVWFSLLVAVFGLGLQAYAVKDQPEPAFDRAMPLPA